MSPRAAPALFATWLLAACASDETGIRLTIDSDLDVPGELSVIRLRVSPLDPGPADLGLDRTLTLRAGEGGEGDVWGLPLTLGIAPHGGDASRSVALRVEPTTVGGCALAPVERRQGFVAGRVVDVRIELLRDCCGVSCDVNEYCTHGGDCVPFEDVPPMLDGGLPDAAVPEVDAGCTRAMESCTDGVEHVCDPATGGLVSRPCTFACSTFDPRCVEFIPSNVEPSLLPPADAAPLDVATSSTLDTSTCALAGVDARVEPQLGGGSEVCLVRTGALTLAAGATLTVRGTRPLVFLASGPVVVAGTIDASANGGTPGPGGSSGGPSSGARGGGSSGGYGGSSASERRDGGGGGGSLCGQGGAGGAGGGIAGGTGGPVPPPTELSPLRGGGGGGAGAGRRTGGTDNAGRGGGGGGAVQISSSVSIAIDGTVLAGGGGGGPGTAYGPIVDGSTNWGSGGGGGSGGAILIEAPLVTIGPSGALGASGGGGGGSAGRPPGGSATNGQRGDDGGLDRASGGTEGGSEYGANGGGGSQRPYTSIFGSMQSGLSGGGGNSDSDSEWGNGGGGGGGAGCVLFRTLDGAMPAGALDRSSPAASPGIVSLPLRGEQPCFTAMDGARRYSVCREARSWVSAHNYCAVRGAHLATIESATQDDFLRSTLSTAGIERTWIGLSDRDETSVEGAFVWMDGAPLGAFAPWSSGSPSPSEPAEDCVELVADGWNDQECADLRQFVCEHVPEPHLLISADNEYDLFVSSVLVHSDRDWTTLDVVPIEEVTPLVIGIVARNVDGARGVAAELRTSALVVPSDASWYALAGAPDPAWLLPGFGLTGWAPATVVEPWGAGPTWSALSGDLASDVQWIWGDAAATEVHLRVEVRP